VRRSTAVLAVLLAGCGGGPPPLAPVPAAGAAPDDCRLEAGQGLRPDTLKLALSDSVDGTHAPVPANESERLLFRQLYETLVRLSCSDSVRPALARSWHAESDGRVWTFVLRDGRFSDGTPITAEAVGLAWARNARGAAPWPGIASVAAASERELVVTFAEPRASVPPELADPALAVAGVPGRNGWPATSGDYRIGFDEVAVTAGTATRRIDAPAVVGAAPLLSILVAPRADPIDLLDAGAAALVTRRPSVLAYAAGGRDRIALPLAWDRVYVALLAPASVARPLVDTLAGVRAALARDAVRAEARGAEPPYWWETRATCRGQPWPERAPVGHRIVYPAADSTARELAERAVALPAAARLQLVAVGLGASELTRALAAGGEVAYIVPYPRPSPAACGAVPARPRGALIVPLVETRARAVLRRGAEVWADGDGGARFAAPASAAGSP
jgi:hypothetical protein